MYAAIFVGHSQDVFDIHIFNRALQRNRRETRKRGCGHFLGDNHAAIPWL